MRFAKTGVIFGVAAFFLLFHHSSAQEKREGHKSRGGSGYVMLGWSTPNLDALNAGLRAQGYATFSDPVLSFGAGGHLYFNRILFGGEAHGLKITNGTVSTLRGEYKTVLDGAFGFFSLGYLALPHDRLQIYPMLGFGGGVIRLRIETKTAPSFEEVLNDPGRSAELSNGGLLFNLGLGVDSWFGIHRERRDLSGVVLGLRAGYILTPVARDWYLHEKKIRGGPEYDFSGPYVRLLLGLGAVASR